MVWWTQPTLFDCIRKKAGMCRVNPEPLLLFRVIQDILPRAVTTDWTASANSVRLGAKTLM